MKSNLNSDYYFLDDKDKNFNGNEITNYFHGYENNPKLLLEHVKANRKIKKKLKLKLDKLKIDFIDFGSSTLEDDLKLITDIKLDYIKILVRASPKSELSIEAKMFKVLITLKKLSHLILIVYSNHLFDIVMKEILKFKKITRITIYQHSDSNEERLSIDESIPEHLNELNIYNAKINNLLISFISKNKSIKYISLVNCGLDDKNLIDIFENKNIIEASIPSIPSIKNGLGKFSDVAKFMKSVTLTRNFNFEYTENYYFENLERIRMFVVSKENLDCFLFLSNQKNVRYLDIALDYDVLKEVISHLESEKFNELNELKLSAKGNTHFSINFLDLMKNKKNLKHLTLKLFKIKNFIKTNNLEEIILLMCYLINKSGKDEEITQKKLANLMEINPFISSIQSCYNDDDFYLTKKN